MQKELEEGKTYDFKLGVSKGRLNSIKGYEEVK